MAKKMKHIVIDERYMFDPEHAPKGELDELFESNTDKEDD